MTRVADVFKSMKSRGSKSLPTYVFWSSEDHMVESRPKACCLVNSDVNGQWLGRAWSFSAYHASVIGDRVGQDTRSIDSISAEFGAGTILRRAQAVARLLRGGYGSVTSADHSQRVAW